MAVARAVFFTAFHLKHDYLLIPPVANNGCFHGSPFDQGIAKHNAVVICPTTLCLNWKGALRIIQTDY